MLTQKAWIACAVLLGAVALISGCMEQGTSKPFVNSAPTLEQNAIAPSAAKSTAGSTQGDAEHAHKPGAHGGIMVSLGRDSYHAEAVFEKGGLLRLYMLGKDESRVIDVEKQTLRGFVKAEGDNEAEALTFDAEPQEGDANGRTSQFVTRLPEGLGDRGLEVTVPNLVISGERFRLGFSSATPQHEATMPDKVTDNEERELYLTPGGKYTASDIIANGNITAVAKFKGLKSSHDMFPKKGDKICPVTKTKANPEFKWVVDGKKYEFCCPPCVDEFVKTAKTKPDEIRHPESYVKQ